MLLKFNNIRDLSDARYAAAAMAEWIGFTVGESDSLHAGKIQEILGWCAGPKLVLELAEGTDANLLMGYLDVLPVEALEMDISTFLQLQHLPVLSELQIIIRDESKSTNAPGIITHSDKKNPDPRHIQKIHPESGTAESIAESSPWAISIDCFEVTDPALKNYDHWNDFFEALEMYS